MNTLLKAKRVLTLIIVICFFIAQNIPVGFADWTSLPESVNVANPTQSLEQGMDDSVPQDPTVPVDSFLDDSSISPPTESEMQSSEEVPAQETIPNNNSEEVGDNSADTSNSDDNNSDNSSSPPAEPINTNDPCLNGSTSSECGDNNNDSDSQQESSDEPRSLDEVIADLINELAILYQLQLETDDEEEECMLEEMRHERNDEIQDLINIQPRKPKEEFGDPNAAWEGEWDYV
jgi:hypothetical protein